MLAEATERHPGATLRMASCRSCFDLDHQLTSDQDRRHDGSADLVRLPALRHCNMLPIRLRRAAGLARFSVSIGLATRRCFRRTSDGRCRRVGDIDRLRARALS